MDTKNKLHGAGVAKAHNISDSEDSDSTIDPRENSFDGSQDLFDSPVKPEAGTSAHSDSNLKTAKATCSTSCDPYDADTDVEEQEEEKPLTKKKPCKYGSKCYRKNPSHLQEFHHHRKRPHSDSDERPAEKVKVQKTENRVIASVNPVDQLQPFNFFLTKVAGIPDKHNTVGALSLKDILSEDMGNLKQSCHFNFMFDIPWIVKQYPSSFRKLPMLLVHGEQRTSEQNMKAEASQFPHIALCRAPLEIPYGTHHTKMMFLLYTTGLRVVIHTANLISNDWHQKSQGIWVSPVFPPLSSSEKTGDSLTGFKRDLLQYLAAYRAAKLAPWERIIQAHDMAQANVFLIGSVPGRHTLNSKQSWGHLKMKKVLFEHGPDKGMVERWPMVGQFSSIGSLGPTPDAWLLNEFGTSLSSCNKALSGPVSKSKFHLMFPSLNNIRLSLEGYNGGGCVPYSIKTASKQPWLTPFFCHWKSDGRGRSRAVPHIKTYTRFSPDGTQAAWFMVTSANLSKAAWGALEKKGSQLMIRSYELGVLFLPQYFGCKKSFPVTSRLSDVLESNNPVFPLPYDLPPSPYVKGDRPWFCDVPCVDLPDTFGTKWCPPL